MFHPLSNFLNKAINKTGVRKSVEAALIVESARPIILQILPEFRPADFEVISFRNGTLHLGVANPAAGQELKIHESSILEALRETFPENDIERFRFTPLVAKQREF